MSSEYECKYECNDIPDLEIKNSVPSAEINFAVSNFCVSIDNLLQHQHSQEPTHNEHESNTNANVNTDTNRLD